MATAPQDTVWYGLIDTETHFRYFAKISERYRNKHTRLVIGLSVSSGVSASTIVVDYLPDWTGPVSALSAFVFTVLVITLRWNELAARADMASMHFNHLRDEWTDLLRYGDPVHIQRSAKHLNSRATIPMYDCPIEEAMFSAAQRDAKEKALGMWPPTFAAGDDMEKSGGPVPAPPPPPPPSPNTPTPSGPGFGNDPPPPPPDSKGQPSPSP